MVVNLIAVTSCFDAAITFCRAERKGVGAVGEVESESLIVKLLLPNLCVTDSQEGKQ